MTPENFTYWLQGFIELHGELPTQEQWDMIKKHLQIVFVKVTDKPVSEWGIDEIPAPIPQKKKSLLDYYQEPTSFIC